AELERTARRLGATNVTVEVADASAPNADRGSFDRVLVDPPCSGLGTLQARADLRWRMARERLGDLARLQGRILHAGARALRPGGVLVYSTCTISAIENEHLIESFLDSHPDFSLDDLAAELPEYASGSPRVLMPGTAVTLPHRDRTAGFFIARLRRGGGGGRAEPLGEGAGRSRPAVPALRRALAAPDEPAGPLSLRVLPASLRADLGLPELRRALD